MLDSTITSLIDGQAIKTYYHTYTSSDGVELCFQRIGSGKPLLLIHGLGSSSLDWEFQYAALGEQYELIIPDLRGFGRSTQAYFDMPNPSASMNLFASDMQDLMRHLNINSCPVMGYSMGGPVAFQLALDNLEHQTAFRPESLIIVNSLASFKIDSLKKMYLIGLRKLFTRIFSMPKLANILGNKLFPDNPALAAEMAARNGKNKKQPYTASLNALLKWQAGPKLKDINQRTIFITADGDYSPPSEKQKSVDIMQNASLQIIANSLHGTPMDQPEAFNQAVLDFLA
jgi:pimeloyl-ACP methyl ester carboxylesterase